MNTDETLEQLREWCAEHRHWVSPFDQVKEDTAAAMCGNSPETLRHWRGTDRRLPCKKTRAGWRYNLTDIAEFLNSDVEDC